MKKIGMLFLFLLLVAGCSNDDETKRTIAKYESEIKEQQQEIKEQQKEIKELNEEIEENKLIPDVNYRLSLQQADREARKIMLLISERDFEELKRVYKVEFEVKDGAVDFGVPEFNSPFPIEWASNFMYIGNFIKHPDGMDISYFISNPKNDRSELIHISFGDDMAFKYIYVGDA